MVRIYVVDSHSAPATTVSQLLKYPAPNALSHGRLVNLGFGQVTKNHPVLRHRTQIVQTALVAGYVCSAEGCGEGRGTSSTPTRWQQTDSDRPGASPVYQSLVPKGPHWTSY